MSSGGMRTIYLVLSGVMVLFAYRHPRGAGESSVASYPDGVMPEGISELELFEVPHVDLSRCDLTGSRLSGALLREADLPDANATGRSA